LLALKVEESRHKLSSLLIIFKGTTSLKAGFATEALNEGNDIAFQCAEKISGKLSKILSK
jgi:hypothetical protein